jgi:hypothetical protein
MAPSGARGRFIDNLQGMAASGSKDAAVPPLPGSAGIPAGPWGLCGPKGRESQAQGFGRLADALEENNNHTTRPEGPPEVFGLESVRPAEVLAAHQAAGL